MAGAMSHRCHIPNIGVSRNGYGMHASGRRRPCISLQETSVSYFAPLRTTALSLAIVLAGGFAASAHAADVTGAGASFVYPIMSKWSADYAAATQKKVNYQSIGSGGGIAQIKAATVDFGSSDAPMKPEELAKFGLGQFPSVIGGVVPVLNVPGVAPGKLRLTGSLLADMFLGKVKMWNDPAIVAANPGLTLPALAIR